METQKKFDACEDTARLIRAALRTQAGGIPLKVKCLDAAEVRGAKALLRPREVKRVRFMVALGTLCE
jgi:hypothetical protein